MGRGLLKDLLDFDGNTDNIMLGLGYVTVGVTDDVLRHTVWTVLRLGES